MIYPKGFPIMAKSALMVEEIGVRLVRCIWGGMFDF
jgi:hypothetical protein